MKLLKKAADAVNSRFSAFLGLMFGVCGMIFFYAGVQWEKKRMASAVIAAVYALTE